MSKSDITPETPKEIETYMMSTLAESNVDETFTRLKNATDHITIGGFNVCINSHSRNREMDSILLEARNKGYRYRYERLTQNLSEVAGLGPLVGMFTTLNCPSFLHIIKKENELVGFYIFRIDKKQKIIDLNHFFLLKRFRQNGICKKFIHDFFIPLKAILTYDIVVDTDDDHENLVFIWRKMGFYTVCISQTNKTVLRLYYVAKDKEYNEIGNSFFREKKYVEAIQNYSRGLSMNGPDLEKLYSNRSAAYVEMTMYNDAYCDALMATKLSPKWSKGYYRLGNACVDVGKVYDAMDAYTMVTQLDPKSKGTIAKTMSDLEPLKEIIDCLFFDMLFGASEPEAFITYMRAHVQKVQQEHKYTRNRISMVEIQKYIHDTSNIERYLQNSCVVKLKKEYRREKKLT